MSNRTENIWFIDRCFPLCGGSKKMQEVLEFDSNFKIMSVILTYVETGEQEECPKRQDGLKLDFKCHSP